MSRPWLAIAGVTLAAGGLGFYLSSSSDVEEPMAPPSALADPGLAAEQAPVRPAVRPVTRPPSALSAADSDPNESAADEDTEDDEAVDQAGIKLSVMNAVRGLDRPGRAIGEPATAAAMEAIDMAELAIDDARYDPVIEAHQLFNAFEMDVLSRGQLDQAAWQELQAKYEPAKKSMLERSVELAHAGEADASESLLLEWNALEAGYQEQVE